MLLYVQSGDVTDFDNSSKSFLKEGYCLPNNKRIHNPDAESKGKSEEFVLTLNQQFRFISNV